MGTLETAPDHAFIEHEVRNNDFNEFADTKLGFVSSGLILTKTKGSRVEYSFNGIDVHGRLDNCLKSISMDNKSVSRIWFRKTGPVVIVRIDAWLKVVT